MTTPKAVQRITCSRCCVGYRVQEKPSFAKKYRCPDCRLVFWEHCPTHKPIRLGVTPQDRAEWLDDGLR